MQRGGPGVIGAVSFYRPRPNHLRMPGALLSVWTRMAATPPSPPVQAAVASGTGCCGGLSASPSIIVL